MSIQIFTVKEGNEYLSSHAGLALIGALLSKTSINERVDEIPIMYKPPISNGDIIRTMIGLCCLGYISYPIYPTTGQRLLLPTSHCRPSIGLPYGWLAMHCTWRSDDLSTFHVIALIRTT